MVLIAQWRRQREESVKGKTEIIQSEQQKQNKVGGKNFLKIEPQGSVGL